MNPDQIRRTDFPIVSDGYDPATVDAHLTAVAASMAALEARLAAFEVERDALRRQAARSSSAEIEVISEAATPPGGNPIPPDPRPGPALAGVPAPRPPASPAEDEVSARLIATKMALDGADREEIRLKLSDGYSLSDLDSLLDDVIERVG
ncbi:MAG: hypothetical protein WBW44_10985 [Solirubrobacterales bacterium]